MRGKLGLVVVLVGLQGAAAFAEEDRQSPNKADRALLQPKRKGATKKIPIEKVVGEERPPRQIGKCTEAEAVGSTKLRQIHTAKLLATDDGGIIVQDTYGYPGGSELVDQDLAPRGGSESGPIPERTYRYSGPSSYLEVESGLVGQMMMKRECASQYSAGKEGYFEIAKLAPTGAAPVRMPGVPDMGPSYDLLIVDDHTHQKVHFLCEVDSQNPIRCEKGATAITQTLRSKKVVKEAPAGSPTPESLPGKTSGDGR